MTQAKKVPIYSRGGKWDQHDLKARGLIHIYKIIIDLKAHNLDQAVIC